MEYKLIRSGRRTLAAEINREGKVIVRAPYNMSLERIENFLYAKRDAIELAIARAKAREPKPPLDGAEVEMLYKKAHENLPSKVEYYAKLMGVTPKSMRVTAARTRFGSCSSRGTLCFSFRLMQYPEEAIDYVVVHELAHLVELNHSKKFWAVVEKYMPDYKRRRAMLKE